MHFKYGDFDFQLTNWLIIIAFLCFISWRFARKYRKRQTEQLGAELSGITRPNTVAIIDVSGPIYHEARAVPRLARDFAAFGGPIGKTLTKLSKNPNVIGAIVRFDTPGGTVTGSVAINRGIEHFKAAGKPIIGHALTMCASGGMLATAAATETYAQEGALIGSIGVAGPTLISYKGVTDIDGGLLGGGVGAKEIVAQVLTAGKGKAFGNPYDVPDPSVVAHFKQMLDREYTRFKEVVSAGRGITMEKLNEIGAMIFDPTEAQELKLIDGIADEEQIRDIIAAKLGVDRDKCSFVRVRTSGGTSAALSTAQTFVADAVGYDAHASLAKALRVSPVNLVYERWF